MKQNKKLILILLIGIIVLLSGCTTQPTKEKITIFKSPTCGCCVGHASILEKDSYDVESIQTQDMSLIKQRYNIPRSMESCHTAIIEGYIVEGHIPTEVIEKLLKERPDIDGIALPNMPSGSPGMPGKKTEPWIVYALHDGEISEYTRI